MKNNKLLSKEPMDLRTFFLEIPKTEIHLHLEGMSSVDTIWTLIKKHSLRIPGISSRKDLKSKFQINSLDEFIDLFLNVVQSCYKEVDDFFLLIEDMQTYLEANNIRYAEVFFAPSKFIINGFSFKEMVKVLDSGAKKLHKEHNIEVKYIVDVSRSFGLENALQNLDLTLKNRVDSIIGIGLGGSESKGPAKLFKTVFQKAAKNNLQIVAHAGEDVGPESIWQAIKQLKVARIGHGISAMNDHKLMAYLSKKGIPLEICPTSNIFTRKFVKRIIDHPIRQFFDAGIRVTLNTDDPSIFGIGLVDEYLNLSQDDLFSPQELITILRNGIYATFLPQEKKDALWNEAQKKITLLSQSNHLPLEARNAL